MREALVQAAIDLLEREGPDAVQARRLTGALGVSTKVIYHHVGGMPQLLAAVRTEGFVRLDAALADVAVTDHALTDLVAVAFAYRAAGRRAPRLYDLMFGLSAPGWHRAAGHDDDASGAAAAAFGHLVAATARAIVAGQLARGEPEPVAVQLWSMLHGFVGLEIAGNLARVPDPVRDVLVPLGTNLLVGLGADRDQVRAAVSSVAGSTT